MWLCSSKIRNPKSDPPSVAALDQSVDLGAALRSWRMRDRWTKLRRVEIRNKSEIQNGGNVRKALCHVVSII